MKTAFYLMLTMAFIIVSFLTVSFAQASTDSERYFPQKMSAKDLLFTCSSSFMTSKGRQRQKYCSGFISGVEESARLFKNLEINPKICLPKGKTANQYRDVYTNYASRKTTKLSKPAALVVIEAFQDAFPCPIAD